MKTINAFDHCLATLRELHRTHKSSLKQKYSLYLKCMKYVTLSGLTAVSTSQVPAFHFVYISNIVRSFVMQVSIHFNFRVVIFGGTLMNPEQTCTNWDAARLR